MKCTCGGKTTPARMISGSARLEFERCLKCDAKMDAMLFIGRTQTEYRGEQAMIEFNRYRSWNK